MAEICEIHSGVREGFGRLGNSKIGCSGAAWGKEVLRNSFCVQVVIV